MDHGELFVDVEGHRREPRGTPERASHSPASKVKCLGASDRLTCSNSERHIGTCNARALTPRHSQPSTTAANGCKSTSATDCDAARCGLRIPPLLWQHPSNLPGNAAQTWVPAQAGVAHGWRWAAPNLAQKDAARGATTEVRDPLSVVSQSAEDGDGEPHVPKPNADRPGRQHCGG